MLTLFPRFSLFARSLPRIHFFDQASAITSDVIGAAIAVHRDKGPGLLESIYAWCLTMELQLRGHRVQRQKNVVIRYIPGFHPRLDHSIAVAIQKELNLTIDFEGPGLTAIKIITKCGMQR